MYGLYALGAVRVLVSSVFLSALFAVFGLLTHSSVLQIPASGWRQRQLQNTCDFFPGNYFWELLSGGLNAHGVHHVYPHLPRGALGWASMQLRVMEPKYYRGFATTKDFIGFFLTRVDPLPLSECTKPSEYYRTSLQTDEKVVEYPKYAKKPHLKPHEHMK